MSNQGAIIRIPISNPALVIRHSFLQILIRIPYIYISVCNQGMLPDKQHQIEKITLPNNPDFIFFEKKNLNFSKILSRNIRNTHVLQSRIIHITPQIRSRDKCGAKKEILMASY
jgi:hypothetical protein